MAHTAPILPAAYLFHRVSDGGGFAPFDLAADAMQGGGTMMNSMTVWVGLGRLIGGVLLIVVIAASVVAVIRWAGRPGTAPAVEAPLAILKRRLAQGEITPQQFETMQRRLEGD